MWRKGQDVAMQCRAQLLLQLLRGCLEQRLLREIGDVEHILGALTMVLMRAPCRSTRSSMNTCRRHKAGRGRSPATSSSTERLLRSSVEMVTRVGVLNMLTWARSASGHSQAGVLRPAQ